MNEKKFVFAIILAISITVIISVSVVITSLNKNSKVALDLAVEENAAKAKLTYDNQEMKEEFLDIAKTLSDSIYSKLLDGTITDEASLREKINTYNNILATNNWDTFGLKYSEKWIGTWYLNEQGFVKFKFAAKSIEPSWINAQDVVDYIVAN